MAAAPTALDAILIAGAVATGATAAVVGCAVLISGTAERPPLAERDDGVDVLAAFPVRLDGQTERLHRLECFAVS